MEGAETGSASLSDHNEGFSLAGESHGNVMASDETALGRAGNINSADKARRPNGRALTGGGVSWDL